MRPTIHLTPSVYLKQFKHLNDRTGHTLGDLLVQEIATHLIRCLLTVEPVLGSLVISSSIRLTCTASSS
ncbi:diguanylate cyclase domain-containing protein [Undibacterium terreum]|uniref:diguanylate cyclase domain-containing protein n=1 Tax=Undibacterium terreum TaxID=1224302 RepID=UPI0016657549